MDAVETVNYKGHVIEIVQDEDPPNPREFSSLGTMIAFHTRYNLGDKTDIKSEQFSGWSEMESYLTSKRKAAIVMPLYLLDHSGLCMRTRDFPEDPGGWDSGRVGFIYATAGQLRKEYGNKWASPENLAKARKVLESEVNTYSEYLSGQVYGYVVKKGDKIVDSVWGYYGDWQVPIDEAKKTVDAIKSRKGTRYAVKPAAKSKKSDSGIVTAR